MKILHVMLSYFPDVGGAQICVDQLARRQIAAGDAATVMVAWKSYRFLSGRVPYQIVPMLPGLRHLDQLICGITGISRAFSSAWLWLVSRYLAADILHAHMALPAGGVATSIRQAVPVIITCHGIDVQIEEQSGYGLSRDPDMARHVGKALRKANVVTVVGEAMVADCVRIAGPSINSKVRILANGVDSSRLNKLAVHTDNLRLEHNVAEGCRLALCLGRNHPKKNFRASLALLQILDVGPDNLKFVLAGAGFDALLAEARDNGLADHFIEIGAFSIDLSVANPNFPSDAQINVMKDCDFLYLPSFIEGFPLVVPEALACGLPVLASRGVGVESTFDRRVCRVFDDGDLADQARLARELLADCGDPHMREACKQASRKLDWKEISVVYKDIYQCAISER